MKKMVILVLILTLLSPLVLAEKKKKNISLEVFSGCSFINPVDLNQLSDYNTALFDYYENLYNSFSYGYRATNATTSGEFKSIKNALVFGGRIKYSLPGKGDLIKKSSKFAFSLGLRYFMSSVDSKAGLDTTFDDFYLGEYSLSRQISPQNLWVEGFVPQVGIHYSIYSVKNLKFEIFAAGGVIFAKCGSFEQYLITKTELSGFVSNQETITDFDGKGTGIALEGGIKIQMNIMKSLGIFLEGGYSIQKINDINGPASLKTNSKDINKDGIVSQFNWTGPWKLNANSLGKKPTIVFDGMNTANTSEFVLDLSEFYIRAGVSIHIF